MSIYILAFISYEKACGDKLEIVCENDDILSAVQDAADKIDGKEYIILRQSDILGIFMEEDNG